MKSFNWPPPAYSPDTGLFYTHERNGFNLVYLTEPDPRGSMGLAGKAVGQVGAWPSALKAIDYKTGKAVWRHEFPGVTGAGGGVGLLATGSLSNAPQTYKVQGRQPVLVAVGDTLYAFALY